jgi:guanylate kinase
MGFLYILAAPSGGGKTSLVKGVVDRLGSVVVSVSHTTRTARPGEVQGQDYHFVTPSFFDQMIENKEFLEHAEVFGYHYGTSSAWVLETLRQGKDIILEIDWQGARQIKQLFPDACSIYIMPPSMGELEKRLVDRQQDEETVINGRMAEARAEMSHAHEFDYLVINDDYDQALLDISTILLANRLKMARQQKKYEKLLAEMAQNS